MNGQGLWQSCAQEGWQWDAAQAGRASARGYCLFSVWHCIRVGFAVMTDWRLLKSSGIPLFLPPFPTIFFMVSLGLMGFDLLKHSVFWFTKYSLPKLNVIRL